MAKKTCSACIKELDIGLFGISKKSSDGRERQCKKCRKERRTKHLKSCFTCKKDFTSDRKSAKFCSKRCSSDSQKYNLEDVASLFSKEGCTLLAQSYVNANTNLSFECSCGNISEINLGNFLNGHRCFECGKLKRRGKNHPRWDKRLTQEERDFKRVGQEYVDWRKAVYERDNFACVSCGDKKGGNLVAHHLDGHNWCKERRTEVSNGVTLCVSCHNEFHSTYGYGNNTEDQYKEWQDAL